VKHTGPLDEISNDSPAYNVLYDDTLHSRSVHVIIQSCRAPRARHGRKPTADLWARIGHELADEDVRTLRTAPETALPGDLGGLPRLIRLERRVKQRLKRARSFAITTLRPAADHDLEAPRRQATMIAAKV